MGAVGKKESEAVQVHVDVTSEGFVMINNFPELKCVSVCQTGMGEEFTSDSCKKSLP